MKFQNIFFVLLLVSVLFPACEDVIDLDLEEGKSQFVIDAWINNMPEEQVIKLRYTSTYFNSTPSPKATGAAVVVTSSTGESYTFTDENNNGDYTWTPAAGESFGGVGEDYLLSVVLDGKEYTAVSTMNRVMPIDTITYEDREEERGDPAGIYAEFFAQDFVGTGDSYWIKAFKNDQYLNKPSELNTAYDAGFTPGGNIDGLVFITPIRTGINRVPDSGDDAVDDSDQPPYKVGDKITVEIHSLTDEAFFFLEQALIQMTLGDQTIFASPVVNVPTNIISPSGEEDEAAVGFFCVSAVSRKERMVE
ncbi:MAG: DUF4249 domain-containing protein [Saprospiraceae bacterium]